MASYTIAVYVEGPKGQSGGHFRTLRTVQGSFEKIVENGMDAAKRNQAKYAIFQDDERVATITYGNDGKVVVTYPEEIGRIQLRRRTRTKWRTLSGYSSDVLAKLKEADIGDSSRRCQRCRGDIKRCVSG